MISPDVRIVDLEPEGFGHVNQVLSRRAAKQGPEIHLLHDAGKVLNVVHTAEGVIADYRGNFTSPQSRAEEIRSMSGVARVILIDQSLISGLPSRLVGIASSVHSQGELLWEGAAAFWSDPGIATAPAPPIPPWPKVHDRIKSFGDDFWVLLAAWEGERPAVDLLGHFQDGYLTLITSLGNLPPRAEAVTALERAESLGPLPLALLCDLESLDRILSAPEPIEELRNLTGVISARGIEELIPS